jgi:hypothetical protein
MLAFRFSHASKYGWLDKEQTPQAPKPVKRLEELATNRVYLTRTYSGASPRFNTIILEK